MNADEFLYAKYEMEISQMKKTIIIIASVIVLVFLVYFVGSGFVKNTSAFIEEYSLSDDGKQITIRFGVSSSVGYIRNAAVHQQHGGKLYIECYSAFGGLNGSIGAKDSFTYDLEEDTAIIALYSGDDCYEEVLYKSDDGTWQRMPNK